MRAALLVTLLAAPAFADGPADNVPDKVRPIPPKGSPVPDADQAELKKGLDELKAAIDAVGKHDLLPDVEVYHKAVRYAVEFDEIYVDPKQKRDDIAGCKKLLATGLERAKQLKENKPAWPTATGLVVRGYRSKIDGSVQPYGLVVPASYRPPTAVQHRLDFWWHGRGELLTEVDFIRQRSSQPGEFVPANAFVVHPYGRYCNANKFAGEIDTLEVLDHVKKHYPIDPYRVVARGFSMGGAACWQFAAHYPSLWCAAAPGAGFAETPEFLNVFQAEKVEPAWYEKKLWRMYNATDHAANFFNLPTVAYSGEIDKQKQAADVMARELLKEDIELTHVIGPKTPHRYEAGAKVEINRRIDELADAGRDSLPYQLRFVTHTLRYNRSGWVRIDGLERHWEPGRVDGSFGAGGFGLATKGVTALTIDVSGGNLWTGLLEYPATVAIDDDEITVEKRQSDRSFRLSLAKTDGKWAAVKSPPGGLRKVHGLQGPIDDAFMDRFVMVRPTGQPLNAKVGEWAAKEMKHAVDHWRSQFRGDVPVKDDKDVTDADIASANLVLWGDPASNAVLAKVIAKLPVKWSADGVMVGEQAYPAGTHVPVLIYPNPLNPAKYVVLNSGFTFREYDYLNNARQVPKLPDYAVLDVSVPANSRFPGKVVRAGFFGEKWELLADEGRGEKLTSVFPRRGPLAC